MFNLKNKNYIVTGAGSGIGRETSRVLSEQGATVIMMDVNAEGLTETAAIGGQSCHPRS